LSPSITSDHLLGHRYSRWRLHASASLRRISRTASTAPLIGTNHACRPCLASFTHAPSGLAYLDYSQWHHRITTTSRTMASNHHRPAYHVESMATPIAP
jgi:hypothetical protein